MRKRPRNRTVTECHKIECVQKHRDGTHIALKAYVHIDREAQDENGLVLGPVVGVRVTPDNEIAGSLFEEVMHLASELISREVQTVAINRALQGRP
jgi:hypothetical protein